LSYCAFIFVFFFWGVEGFFRLVSSFECGCPFLLLAVLDAVPFSADLCFFPDGFVRFQLKTPVWKKTVRF